MFTRSAESRYNNIHPQLFDRFRVGQGRTMHHQKASELAKKADVFELVPMLVSVKQNRRPRARASQGRPSSSPSTLPAAK